VNGPFVTVFTSTVYGDVARLWHACIARAFPRSDAVVEIFDDSPGQDLDPALYPGAHLLRRTPSCRDFHEAYNEAVRRAATPLLAFVDTDVFWTSGDLWPRVRAAHAASEVAAVSCVSRSATESHGTFAVVVKSDVYRSALAELPGGFFPAIENLGPDQPRETWRLHDTGDLLTRAVVARGFEVRLLNLERSGDLVRFDGITLTRRAAEWMGGRALVRMARGSDYFWHGHAGNVILQRLHDRLFPEGPRYAVPFRRLPVLTRVVRGGPRQAIGRARYLQRLLLGAWRIGRFVKTSMPTLRPRD
jgi:hypothetical protein